jgi:ABC-type transport system involved in multi-copper enzyme maturation permease subunit
LSDAVTATAAPWRDTSRPLGLLPGARRIFDVALEQMLWSSRSLLMAILLGLPIVFALLYRFVLAAKLPAQVRPFDLYAAIVALYYIRNALPLAALFYSVSLIADEVEEKTITYLFTRPIQRASILLGKFAAYLATTLALALPAIVVTFFVLVTAKGFDGVGAAVPHLFRDMSVIALTFLTYGAFFTLLGVGLRRPVIPGLLFLFIWELVANLPGYLPRLTITIYLRSLIPHRPPAEWLAEVFGQALPALLCLEAIAGMVVVFLGAALWIFSRKEYVLEQ